MALTNASASVLLTIEGKVETARAGMLTWTTAQTNQLLQAGDRIRTGSGSRATIRLLDLSVLRVNELTTLEIRPPSQPGQRMLLDLKSGKSYLFNREKPTELQFRTPLASGAIRGTEFALSVEEGTGRTVVTLLEGTVALNPGPEELLLTSGEQGIVEPGQPPRKTAVINAVNVIQWTLYYPAVIAAEELAFADAERPALRESLAAYERGDVLAALALYPANRPATSDIEKIYHAAVLLAAGQVEQVEAALAGFSTASPLADALRRVIATVKNLPASAARPPALASEWMAESYALQARSDLGAALVAAKNASAHAPGFGGAWVRVAELEASHGRTRAALDALDEGLRHSPRHAAGVALKGFLFLAQDRTDEAIQIFDQAIALDGGLGSAWLGRGLARIRRGDGDGGRGDLMVAAVLEPQRAVLRSYLGKAFIHTRDDKRAEKELGLAQKLDPNDPTAWLYSALLKQQQNRINEAVRDLEHSKELNDNRSVYQSAFRLDQDLAVRRANLAGIYHDAGMTEWSVREAARAVNDDYGNYSAHLFLANSYDALRDPRSLNLRYETAWFSELLLADLLAPASAGTFPLTTSQAQYARFFERNHLGGVADVQYFSHGDWIVRGSQYGIIDDTSWAVDVFYQTNRGFRANNSVEQLGWSMKFKQQFTPEDTFYVQAQLAHSQSGDLAQYYYQTDASAVTQVKERQEPNLFAGWHHQWAPGSHTLFLSGWLNDELDVETSLRTFQVVRNPGTGNILTGIRVPSTVHLDTTFEAFTAELQQIWENERHTLILGGRVQSGEADTRSFTQVLGRTQQFTSDLDRFSAYGYYNWQVCDPLLLQAGLSYDYLNFPENSALPPTSGEQRSVNQVSPKAGFYWTPLPVTTLRGAYSQSLGGVYYDTSVRLEPTQLGGFNQAFRSLAPESVIGLVPGTSFETFGLALDQKFATDTYLTVAGELLTSDGDRSVGMVDLPLLGGNSTPSSTPQTISYRERALSASLNQLLGKNWSVGARYRISAADLDVRFPELPAPLQATGNRDEQALLQQAELALNYQARCGFFAQWSSTWSHQHNEGYKNDLPTTDFWMHNVLAGYRFLQRRGEVQVGLLNIFNQDYRLNPLTLYNELPRERMLAVRLRLYF